MKLYLCMGDGIDPFSAVGLDGILEALDYLYEGKLINIDASLAEIRVEIQWRTVELIYIDVKCYPVDSIFFKSGEFNLNECLKSEFID